MSSAFQALALLLLLAGSPSPLDAKHYHHFLDVVSPGRPARRPAVPAPSLFGGARDSLPDHRSLNPDVRNDAAFAARGQLCQEVRASPAPADLPLRAPSAALPPPFPPLERCERAFFLPPACANICEKRSLQKHSRLCVRLLGWQAARRARSHGRSPVHLVHENVELFAHATRD